MAVPEGSSPSVPALLAAIGSGSEAIVIAAADGTVSCLSPAAARLLGLPADAGPGMPLGALVPADYLARCLARTQAAGDDDAPVMSLAGGAPVTVQALRSGDETVLRLLPAGPAAEDAERQRIQALIVARSDRAAAVTDDKLRIVYVNPALVRLTGRREEEILHQPLCSLFAAEGCSPDKLAQIQQQFAEGCGYHGEIELAPAGTGSIVSLAAAMTPVQDDRGQLANVVVLLTEVTRERALQRLQRDVLAQMAENCDLARLGTDLCRMVEGLAPDVTCSIVLVDSEKKLRPLAGPGLPDGFAEAVNGVEIGPEVGTCGAATYFGRSIMTPDLATSPAWKQWSALPLSAGLRACWSHPIRLQNGRIAGAFALYFHAPQQPSSQPSSWYQQIVQACLHLCALAIERHEALDHIERLAFFDPLTGLANRRLLQEKIVTVLSLAASLLLIDIDRFKTINDARGHTAGDAMLMAFAARLKAVLGPDEILGRLGGDEFVIVAPDSDGAEAAERAAQVLKAIALPFEIDGLLIPVSASIGISVYPDDSGDASTMLKHADTAMFEAKSGGRGRLRFFNPAMNRLAQERLLLGAALSEAVRANRLRLHYQPQVRVSDGMLYGVEALARWHDPVQGDISPAKFIPLAEETGLIDAITRWALEEACRQLALWRRSGLVVPGVSVNFSPINARDPEMARYVAGTLAQHGLTPDLLTIEITESVMVDNDPATVANLEAIHAMGVHLSMDDFGAGYSSLSSIAHLPVSEVKIDRQFMLRTEEEANTRTVIAAVVRIGHGLGLTVVCEGMETEAQYDLLRELDCHVAQGFLIAPPMSPETFATWLEHLPWQVPPAAVSRAQPVLNRPAPPH